MHGVDFYHPFFEYSHNSSAEEKRLYASMAAQFAAAFHKNWTMYLGESKYPRPYAIESTYDGTTSEYMADKGIKGFIVETPCDVTDNRYNAAPNYFANYSKGNKLAVDMLVNLIQYFGCL
jgi:hypothetical protein